MSPLLRKELRLIALPWVGAMLAAICAVRFQAPPEWLFAIVGLGLIILALAPFGHEISGGTLSLQLVQPINRDKLWQMKAFLLALAMSSVWCVFVSMGLKRLDYFGRDYVTISYVIALPIFAGGLWIPMLFREIISSFFCVFLIPCGLFTLLIALTARWQHPYSEWKVWQSVILMLETYSVVGILWSKRIFMRAQDVPWTGGQISIKRQSASARTWLRFNSKKNPYVALVLKELQLQEVTLILVTILFALHVLCLFLQHESTLGRDKELLSMVIPICWIFSVPFVMGCSTIAEERRMNTLENAVCLPVRTRDSFLVKLVVVSLLGMFVGGMLPGWLMQHSSLGVNRVDWVGGSTLFGLAMTILGLYASSLARTLLQAIPIGMATAGSVFIALYSRVDNLDNRMHSGWFSPPYCPILIGLLSLAATVLAYGNFRRIRIGAAEWVTNGVKLVFVTAVSFILAAAVYHRAWECVVPLEQLHGAPRISGVPKLGGWVSTPVVLLPDGRLWAGIERSVNKMNAAFLGTNDWVEISPGSSPTLALRADGSLWMITEKWRTTDDPSVAPLGKDHDWKKFGRGFQGNLILKQNGSVWRFDQRNSERGLNALLFVTNLPRADWDKPIDYLDAPPKFARATDSGHRWRWRVDYLGLEEDGTIWVYGDEHGSIFGQQIHPDGGTTNSASHQDKWHQIGDGHQWQGITSLDFSYAALDTNGNLYVDSPIGGQRVSRNHDWIALDGNHALIALARDGTLACWHTELRSWWLAPSRRPSTVNIFDSAR